MGQYTDYPVMTPGRLKSAAVNGIVADAEDLYDINLNKSQKQINEQSDGYRGEIDAIVAAQTPLALSVSPSLIEAGIINDISVLAKADLDNQEETCRSISVLRDNTQTSINSVDARQASGTDIYQPQAHGTVKYKAVFNIRGIEKEKEVNITAHFPIYYGAGSDKNLPAKASLTKVLKSSPAGSYSITVPTGGGFIFFMIPDYMNLGTVKSQGFDVPMMQAECSVAGYKAYRNTNDGDLPIDAGTYTFVVS